MTSVTPRRPVARRFSRRMAAASSNVRSTRKRRAPSHAATRRAIRARRSTPLLRMTIRADPATGLRVVDAVVVHPAEHADELGLDLLDLLQRHRCLGQLTRV